MDNTLKIKSAANRESQASRDLAYMGPGRYLVLLWKGGILHNLELLAGFPGDWLSSRKWGHLFCGLPTLLLAGWLTYALFFQRSQLQASTAAAYEKHSRQYFEQGDYEKAMLFLARSQQINQSGDSEFLYALCVQETSGPDSAAPLMESLVRSGFDGDQIRPHMWLVNYYAQSDRLEQEQRLVLIRAHLERITELAPKHAQAIFLLSDLLVKMGDVPAAVQRLEKIAPQEPAALVRLGALYELIGEEAKLRKTIGLGIQRYRRLLEEDEGNLAHLAVLSQFLVKDLQFSQAIQLLEQTHDTVPEENRGRLGELIVRALLAWYANIRNQPEKLPLRIEIAQRLVDLGPGQPDVLVVLAELMAEDENLEDSVKTSMLHEALAKGTAPQMVHFVLGSTAYRQQDYATAERHWELAYDKSDRLAPILQNNLAMVFAERPMANLEAALELADQAVTALPHYAEFRDTRGKVRALRGEWKEAILDLQLAVRKYPDRVETLTLLEKAYRELGDDQMAEAYRKRIQELQKKSQLGANNR